MKTVPLLPGQPVTERGDAGSAVLIEVIQRLVKANQALEARHRSGSGSPEGVISAPVGTIYSRADGGTGTTLYVKESGSGPAGWVAK